MRARVWPATCARRLRPCGPVFVVSVLAALVAAAPAAAAPSSPAAPCHTDFDPYAYTAAAVRACGVEVSTSATTTQLPGGGSKTVYTMPDGDVTTLYSPPEGFDPVTASSAKLTEYGFAVPSASDGLEAMASWQGMMSRLTHPAPNPPFLVAGAASAGGGFVGAYPGSSANWSGYKANTGGFTFSYASWKEPTYGRSRCSSNSAVVWTGIGGWNGNRYLGQDGTAHGAGNDQPGGANHQMWEEVLPQQQTIQPLPVTGSAGDEMYANTDYNGSAGRYTGTVGDITKNAYKNWQHAGTLRGATGEAIVERPMYGNQLRDLSNFQTMHFTTAGENSTSMNNFSKANRTGLEMTDSAGTDMANVGNVGSQGTFPDTQHSCS